MRICHITSRHNWDDARIYQRACIGLLKEGFEIHLIATCPDIIPVESGVHFHWLKQRKGWSRRIISSREAYKQALDIDVDIFHFHDPDLLPWMLLLSLKSKKVIYDVHENYAERVLALKIPKLVKLLLVKLWSIFEYFCATRYGGIITTTQSMQSLFSGLKTPCISVSNTPYLGMLADTKLIVDKIPFTIYTSGEHSERRNCMQTIEALPIILKKIPGARLVFVGKFVPNGYDYSLTERAKELGVEASLEIAGMLPYKENFERTARMEVGCVFYEDNVNNRVTIPNRLFEYMYARVAVIGESFFEVKKVIEESQCGTIVDSSDPKSIADAVISLFDDITTLRNMQFNGRSKVISTYAYEHELKKMIAFYNSLM